MISRIARPFARTLMVTLAVGGATACSSKGGADKPAADAAAPAAKAANVTLAADQQKRIHIDTVRVVSFRPDVEATGTVAFNGDHSTQVLSPISGPATRVAVQPGAVVTKGQPLVYVSSPDFASTVAAYRKALTAQRNARRIADRDSLLFKNDALARAELEQAQADAAAADADLDAAVQAMRALGIDQAQIDAVRDGKTVAIEAVVRAPIDGTVVEKLISNGQLLQAGTTPCVTIADLSTMWVMANVFAADLKDVVVGQPVAIVTDASAAPLAGRVDYVAAMVDPGTKAVAVRVVAPNESQLLRRDMFVRVRIGSAHEHRGVLVSSASVLRDEQNLPFVFVVAGNNGYARRAITLGARVGDKYEVTSGLAAGDQVVSDGALFLQFLESQ